MAVKKRKKMSKIYFGQPTQDAVIEYLATDNEKERNKIYRERIQYAFEKLAENIIHTFKFFWNIIIKNFISLTFNTTLYDIFY